VHVKVWPKTDQLDARGLTFLAIAFAKGGFHAPDLFDEIARVASPSDFALDQLESLEWAFETVGSQNCFLSAVRERAEEIRPPPPTPAELEEQRVAAELQQAKRIKNKIKKDQKKEQIATPPKPIIRARNGRRRQHKKSSDDDEFFPDGRSDADDGWDWGDD
jgi:hypothetical protein